MSTHNIHVCFHGKISKYQYFMAVKKYPYLDLCNAGVSMEI